MSSPSQAPVPGGDSRPGQSEYSRKAALNVINQSGQAASAHDDPFANWLIQTAKSLRDSWQQAVVGLLVVAAAVYFVQVFRAQNEQESVEAATLFERIGDDIAAWRATRDDIDHKRELNAIPKSTPVASEQDLKKLSDQLELQHTKIVEGLKSLGDAQAPYPEMAAFFGTIMTIEQGDTKALAGLLAAAQVDGVFKLSGRTRMLAELKLLALARASLDSEEQKTAAREALLRIAKEGQYGAPVAILALARTAKSSEDKAAVKRAFDLLVADQAEPIRDEVEALTLN